MPELPEIEHLKRTLEPWLVGAQVLEVRLHRRDVVRRAGSRKAKRGVKPAHLLEGETIEKLIRRGKSLAIVGGTRGAVLGLHMGMTGSMVVAESQQRPEVCGQPRRRDRHVHCEWVVSRNGSPSSEAIVTFRDPRRFGGLWPFASLDDLYTNPGGWARLGPDALTIDGMTLRERLMCTRQPLKAALLNQALIAGVGNIYADEALFAAGIHPLATPRRLREVQWDDLAAAIRSIMQAAIESGGSTLRDYRDAGGRSGAFTLQHQAYGRSGEACVRCSTTLRSAVIGQRTTVFCIHCQRRSFGKREAARSKISASYPQPIRGTREPRLIEPVLSGAGH